MNLISKIVLSILVINLLGLGILSYKVLGNEFKGNANNQFIPTNENPIKKIDSSPETQQKKEEIITVTTYTLNNLKGIDASHWNGNIVDDLPKKDSLHFVICKATQGEDYVDPQFHKNWKYLNDNKIMKGAYHFYIYSQDPIKQAENFYNNVKDLHETDFPLILDIEELSLPKKAIDEDRLKKDVIKFLSYIENRTGRIPIIYSEYSFLNQYMRHSDFSKYPLWLAEYSHGEKPKIPVAWKNKGCKLWQKTDKYNINSKSVDYDIYYLQ